MAVEIPVVVDIEGAFQDAAKRTQQAIKPLQDALSRNTLKMDIPGIGSLGNILKSNTISADDLAEAMAHVRSQMDALNASGKFIRSGSMTKEARQLTIAYAALEAKLRGGANAVEQAISGTKRLGNATKETTTAMRTQTSVLGRLTSTLSAYVSVFSLLRFAKQIRDVTGELEYQRVALGHLIQDEEYGARLFERIKAAAVESPFRIKDLVTYTKQLAAYRIETTQLFDTTKRLADISAGLGVDMNRLILAYGQVRAASVLRGQELRQFTEAGIPLVELLAEKFTELRGQMVSTADVFKLISERLVPFSMIADIFQDMTDVGGEFYQMQEIQAKTLQGRWEKLKDTFDIALQTIGDTKTFRFENDLVIKSLEFLAKNLRVIPKLLAAATTGWITYKIATMGARIEEQKARMTKIQLTAAEMRQIVAKNGNTIATKAYTKALIAQRAATSALSKAFWRLAAAMLANPITAILTGVVALTTAILTFRKATDKASESTEKISEWTDVIERQGNIIGQNKRMDSLITRYERLANKTNRTAKEQQRLSQTMRVLQGQFTDVTIELNNANNSVANQVEQLRKLNKEQKKAAISTLQFTKTQIEARLSELGQQEQEQTTNWLFYSRWKRELEEKDKLDRKDRKNLELATKHQQEFGNALNETSQEINTLQNRLVSIDNILNPPKDVVSGGDSASKILQRLRDNIRDLTDAYKKYLDLRKYKSKEGALSDINVLFPQLSGWEPTYENMVSALEKMRQSYKGNEAAIRIIDQALSNVKFDDMKKKIDDELKRISDEIKRSETARNFYRNILDLTGDEELAMRMSVSVYGGIGDDFKDRIKKQLVDSLSSLDAESFAGLDDKIRDAFDAGDYEYLVKNISKVPEALRNVVNQVANDARKYNAGIVSNLIKSLQKAQTYAQKQEEIAKKSAQRISEINALSVPQSTKDSLLKQNAQKVAEDTAKLQYEAFKDSPMYVEMFSRLETASTRMLQSMRDNIVTLKEQWKDLDPRNLKEMRSRLNEIDHQLAAKNPFKSLVSSIKEYMALNKQMSRRDADEAAVSATNNAEEQKRLLETAKENYQVAVKQHGIKSSEAIATKDELEYQREITDEAIKNAQAAQNTANAYHDAGNRISVAAKELQNWTGYVTTSLDGIGEIVSTFASDEVSETFNTISEGIGKTLNGATGIASSLGRLMMGDLSSIPSLIQGIGDVISGIFGTGLKLKINDLNKKIKVQQNLIEDLEYEYGRLEKAIADSFGTDYIANYNKQLETLRAKEAAYREQARLENDKGKKADKEKIKEYEDSARSAGDSIKDMESQLAEFFTGTDLTSAAKDFAEAWIEAYKEFGNTTAAMKERFNDMIQNMVVNSLAAQLIQGILKPVFDQIDEASKDGDLTAQEIGAVSAMLPERLQMIDEAMTGMVNELGAAGINLRQQAGQFTGISRNIAGASEESITGLAAGINTQNFYMQHIDMNVALILSYLTGGTSTGGASITGEVVDPYKDQMLLYAGHIPTIDQNLSDLLVEVRKVIKPKGTTATHYVATNL